VSILCMSTMKTLELTSVKTPKLNMFNMILGNFYVTRVDATGRACSTFQTICWISLATRELWVIVAFLGLSSVIVSLQLLAYGMLNL